MPKRAFDEDDVAQIRELLTENIAKKPSPQKPQPRRAALLLWVTILTALLSIWHFFGVR